MAWLAWLAHRRHKHSDVLRMHPGLHGYVLHPMFENLVVDLRPLLRLEPVFDSFLVSLK